MNKEKIIKKISLVFIDIFFMALAYVLGNLIFNIGNLTIDPNFPKFIPILILIKIGIYLIAGLYSEETRGMIFEIISVIFANILVYLLLRFVFSVGVSTYLQLIALTVDIVVETISRSLILSTAPENMEEEEKNEVQVFDDPVDYSEELRLNKIKNEILEIQNKESQRQKQTEEALQKLKEKEDRLNKKEEQLKTFEHTLSLKELNIQKELEKLEKEKEEKKKIEEEIKKQEQLRKQRLKQQEILDGVLDNIKTIHTSLNERSKVVDMQEHNLMLKMYDITKKEIEQKTSEEPPKKRKHLTDNELLEATYKKIGQKRKRVSSYKQKPKSPTINADEIKKIDSSKNIINIDNENIKIKKENIKSKDDSIATKLKQSPLINKKDEKDEFMEYLFTNKSNSKEPTSIIKDSSKPNKQQTPKIKKQSSIEDKNIVYTDTSKKNTQKNLKEQKATGKKQDPVDLMFSEDDFSKIADLIEKM